MMVGLCPLASGSDGALAGGIFVDGAGSRKLDRKHVLQHATIISASGRHYARISDFSVSGVRVSCANPPAENDDVIFKRGDLFVAARVAWTDKSGAGLQFYRALEPADVRSGWP